MIDTFLCMCCFFSAIVLLILCHVLQDMDMMIRLIINVHLICEVIKLLWGESECARLRNIIHDSNKDR